MTNLANLESALSDRRANLDNGNPPVEVISADPATGEILPVAVPTPAPAGPVETVTQFPITPPKVLGGIPYARDYVKLAKTISQTEMVPAELSGRWDAITAAFLRGYEMGIPPMQSLDSFNIIQGKVGLKPEAMRALIFDAGHEIILEDLNDAEGNLYGILATCHRKTWPGERWMEYRYTLDDARQMGLLGKDNWKKMPRAMLDARVTAGAGRRYFADILAGMSYTPEELRDFSRTEQEAPPSASQQPPAEIPAPAPTATTSGDQTATAEPVDSAPPGASPSSSQSSPPETKPKRARGAKTSPKAADGPPAAPTSEAAAATAPPSAEQPSLDSSASMPAEPSGPPEQTSLNTGGETPEIAQPEQTALVPTEGGGGSPTTPPDAPATSSASDAHMEAELRRSLSQVISGLPTVQQPLCRAFLGQHFPNRKAADLDATELTLAINIAGGWPESADTYPAPEPDEDKF
jgi:hypothetical protein